MTGAPGPVPTAVFEAHRGRLFGIAYRMTGSVADAEDVVQETWLASRRAASDVGDPTAYLVTAATRQALSRLRAQARRREDYVGPWLPDPLPATPGPGAAGPAGTAAAGADPAEAALLAESVTTAMLVMLAALTPLERAAFVLCEVFAVPSHEAAAALGRSPEAVRQLVSRARRKVRAHPPPVAEAEHARVAGLFARAVASGEIEAVLAILAPAVSFESDAGGLVRAALRPVVGAAKVARLLLALRESDPGAVIEARMINGRVGFVVTESTGGRSVYSLGVADGRISHVWVTRNPDKLTRF